MTTKTFIRFAIIDIIVECSRNVEEIVIPPEKEEGTLNKLREVLQKGKLHNIEIAKQLNLFQKL